MTIPVLVSVPDSSSIEENTLGPLLGQGGSLDRVMQIETNSLKQALRALTGELAVVFGDMKEVAGFKLDQVTVAVEISAEGQLFLVGKAGAKGAITLSFKP